MTQLITILLTSLAITGTYFAIKEFVWTFRLNQGEFDFIYESSPWYYKPLFTCITCMSSIWGTFYYWVISIGLLAADSNGLYLDDGVFTSLIIFWPITCVSCAFLNTWFYKLIEG